MKRVNAQVIFSVIFVFTLMLGWRYVSFAGDIPDAQTAGGLEKIEKDLERTRELERKVKEKAAKPAIEEKAAPAPLPEGERVLIKKIRIEGAVLLSPAEISKITVEFENKQLSLVDMQKVVDLINDAYRRKGYPTSRAYIPPQTIGKDAVLLIRIMEGKVGQIRIQGNKYFKEKIYKKKLTLKQNDPFNYTSLQRSLSSINKKPDRLARAVLVPGKTPGSTDIVLEVEERLPIHIGWTFDNYASRYVGRDRVSVNFEHNNLLGFDDQLYFKFQRSEDSLATLKTGRYLYPVNETLDLGISASYSKTKLGRDFALLDSLGKSTVIGIFLNKTLVSNNTLDLRFNLGFDYKKIRNYLFGIESSRDDTRVAKAGFDIDYTDKLGRTLFTSELDIGIPRMFGGLTDQDARATRLGSGGKFYKGVFNLYRAQPMPFSSSLLWKNSAQYSNYTLLTPEEFQIGGPLNVRGYPPGEHAGDKGIYSALEWSFPLYFMPKKLNVPFTKERLYDTTRLVLFYDWAEVHLSNPRAAEIKHRTLRSCGLGLRFNLTNRLSCKAELGYPLGAKSSDTSHQNLQTWLEFDFKI